MSKDIECGCVAASGSGGDVWVDSSECKYKTTTRDELVQVIMKELHRQNDELRDAYIYGSKDPADFGLDGLFNLYSLADAILNRIHSA